MLKLEGCIVCYNYSDFLEESLYYNLPIMDRIVVVTSPDDQRTINLCHKMSVDCVKTNAPYYNGSIFNKAKAINYGLAHLNQNEWMIQLDADIVLPINMRRLLENVDLSTKKLYTMDRLNCMGRKQWNEYKAGQHTLFNYNCLVAPPNNSLTIGGRILHTDYGGWLPIGYFQLFHADSGKARYPVNGSGNAERSDVLFSLQWDRPDRILLGDMYCIHLETKIKDGSIQFGANWKGRKTPSFTLDEEPYPVSPQYSPYANDCSYGGIPRI